VVPATPGEPGGGRDAFTAEEVFELVRRVRDPEHETLTLEQLRVTTLDQIDVCDDEPPSRDDGAAKNADRHDDLGRAAIAHAAVRVRFTPTIPHCSMATLIGLCLSVKLLRSLPARFKVEVAVAPGTHASETEINKQLADKERVAAALENPHLLKVVNRCISASSGRADDVTYAHDECH